MIIKKQQILGVLYDQKWRFDLGMNHILFYLHIDLCIKKWEIDVRDSANAALSPQSL